MNWKYNAKYSEINIKSLKKFWFSSMKRFMIKRNLKEKIRNLKIICKKK